MASTSFQYLVIRESDSGAESIASGKFVDSEKNICEIKEDLERMYPLSTFIHITKLKKNVFLPSL